MKNIALVARRREVRLSQKRLGTLSQLSKFQIGKYENRAGWKGSLAEKQAIAAALGKEDVEGFYQLWPEELTPRRWCRTPCHITPKQQAKMQAGLRAAMACPEHRAAIRAAWARPEVRERHRAAWARWRAAKAAAPDPKAG